MRSRSSYVATILIPLLLACCLGSVLAARGQQPRAASAEAQAVRMHAEAISLEALSARVRAVAGTQGEDPHAGKPVERALSETVSAALERRVNDAISIESLAVTTGGGVTRVSPLSEMARPVPFTGGQLRAVSLRIKGAYGHYQGLRDYVSSFRALPVAVTGFTASERSFELTLTVFGG
jgi:hypothetical protein